MRSRRSVQADVAEVARRRLELLSAELAEIRPAPVDPPSRGAWGGSGEPSGSPSRPARDAAGRDDAGHPDAGRPNAGRPDEGPVSSGTDETDPAVGGASPPPGPGRHAHRGVGPRAAIAGWVSDRVPPGMQTGTGLRGAHLAVVLLAVLVAGALTWWWLGRGGDQTVALPDAGRAAPLVTPAVASPSSGSGAGAVPVQASPTGSASAVVGHDSVVVDVVGKVRRPGIATLPPGSRVVDALRAVGGARRGVGVAALNLARVVVDGEQIVVGVRTPPGIAPSAASGAAPGSPAAAAGSGAVPMVNINTADQTTLEQLPDIGPVTAKSILDYRAEKGSFSAVDELLEVSGIGDKTLAKIAPYCTI